jgi:hypothetical protein
MGETDAELDRLRRLAFGRTSTPEDERAAAAALAELARIESERSAEPAVAEPVEAPAAEDAGPDASTTPATDVPEAASRFRRWLVPAGVGLLVGAVAASGLTLALAPAPDEPDTAVSNAAQDGIDYFLGGEPDAASGDGTLAGRSPNAGDVQAAERWFAEEQSEEDLEGVGSLLPEFDRSSVRLVHASSLAKVWVAKRVDGQLCLETTVIETDLTTGSCALPPDFTDRGLTVSSEVLKAQWNGSQLRIVATREE